MRRLPRPAIALLAAALALSACGGREAGAPLTFEQPETALDYDVTLDGAPSEEIDGLLRQSLALFRQQENGAQSLAFLRRRATDDRAIAARILRSFGYYEGTLAFTIEEVPPQPATGRNGAPPKPRALVAVTVEPGRPFLLANHGFRVIEDGGMPPELAGPAAFGSPVGAPASAGPILAAEGAAVTRLRNTGRPYARFEGRDAVADMERAELEVESTIAAGRAFAAGEPVFEGLDRVREEYLRTYLTWQPGEVYDERQLTEFQRELVATDLFSSVIVTAPETPPEGETVPVQVRVEEGPRRTVTAGARFSTDRGPAVRGTFEHRNLFGSNEQVRVEAFAGTDEQRLEARYREPQFLRPQQDFTAGAGVRHLELDAYDETAFTVTVGLERTINRLWEVGAGGLIELNQTTDDTGRTNYLLFGLPLFANYDGTKDFLNPTQGWRVRADVTPFMGVSDDDRMPLFTRADLVASHYIALDEAANYVLAARGRVGTILAEDIADVPAGRRLYSGGGGSVRGYADRSIGPQDSSGDPTGGLSVVEAGTELRARFWGDLGGTLFVEAGAVGEEPYFDVEEPQVAAGVGVRYFSPVGPIRLDVGFPLNPRDDDDAFQIYLSIGQAY